MVLKRKNYGVNLLNSGYNLFFNVLMALCALMCLFPLLMVFSISITDERTLALTGYRFLPAKISFYAYEFIFSNPQQMINSYQVSLTVTILGTLLSVLIMALIAYPLSRKDFFFGKQLSYFVFFTMLFNGGLIPSYVINATLLQLNNKIWALILPQAVNAFYIIMLRTFYSTSINMAIIESAKIDGAGEFRIFFKIVAPLSLPGLATVGLFMSVAYWNDWFSALLYITKDSLVPVQYLLMKIQNNISYITNSSDLASSAHGMYMLLDIPSESARMALVIIAVGPIVLAYPFFQKYFIKGLTVGSVKG